MRSRATDEKKVGQRCLVLAFLQPHLFPGLDRGTRVGEWHWLTRSVREIWRGERGPRTQERMK